TTLVNRPQICQPFSVMVTAKVLQTPISNFNLPYKDLIRYFCGISVFFCFNPANTGINFSDSAA
ncbi:MAG: hypothetical protein LIP15_10860, partial [Clostridium sp.]|nr:hypothetical protein [Clostridium sp.]